MDKYTKKIIEAIKKAQTEDELVDIINKIYEDGIEDGYNLREE